MQYEKDSLCYYLIDTIDLAMGLEKDEQGEGLAEELVLSLS